MVVLGVDTYRKDGAVGSAGAAYRAMRAMTNSLKSSEVYVLPESINMDSLQVELAINGVDFKFPNLAHAQTILKTDSPNIISTTSDISNLVKQAVVSSDSKGGDSIISYFPAGSLDSTIYTF